MTWKGKIPLHSFPILLSSRINDRHLIGLEFQIAQEVDSIPIYNEVSWESLIRGGLEISFQFIEENYLKDFYCWWWEDDGPSGAVDHYDGPVELCSRARWFARGERKDWKWWTGWRILAQHEFEIWKCFSISRFNSRFKSISNSNEF
jgi:hypothetical protein